jgi:hypothetical protein
VGERPTVFLHIGAPKTGTTYLQSILFTNRAALRHAGLLYPGKAVRSHFWAAQDLRETAFRGYAEPQIAGAWSRLVDEIRGHRGNAIIDHENFAAASRAQIERALTDLDFADVRLIFTARDIARQLPAAWQERMKNRDTLGYREFLDRVHGGMTGAGPRRWFWPLHDWPEILERWSHDIAADHVHVVTLPRSGADPALLWHRFAGVVGIDPAGYNLDVTRENTSLTAAEAAVLRELNETIKDADIPWPVYRSAVKHGLSAALGAQRTAAARIELPEDVYEWVVAWSQDAIGRLRTAGYSVTGDLDELLPGDRPTGADPDSVPAADRAAAAGRMLAAMLQLLAEQSGEHRKHAAGAVPAAPRGAEVARRVAARAERGGWLAPLRAGTRRRHRQAGE